MVAVVNIWCVHLEKGDRELNNLLESNTSAKEYYPILVILKDNLDSEKLYEQVKHLGRAERKRVSVESLKEFSEMSQKEFRQELKQLEKSGAIQVSHLFWLRNMVSLKANKEGLLWLDSHRQVDFIVDDSIRFMLPEGQSYNKNLGLETFHSDGSRATPYHLELMSAPEAWQLGYKGDRVMVAVIDTGVNYNHTDLKNRMWQSEKYPKYGYNIYDDNDDPMDKFGHGTHCAGIVAGDGTSGLPTGVAPESTIMAIKTLSDSGHGYPSQTWEGVEFAVENGADIISMSLGWSGPSSLDDHVSRELMVNVLSAGVVATVAAGNEGSLSGTIRTPGTCPPPWNNPEQIPAGGKSAVITVGAIDENALMCEFSSRGPVYWRTPPFDDYGGNGLFKPDVVAPGNDVLSLDHLSNDGYREMGGTSQATPGVAGIAALMISKSYDISPEEICKVLETSANKIVDTKNNDSGSGRANALNAISAMGVNEAPKVARYPSPENEEEYVASSPTFTWYDGGYAEQYQISLGTDNPPTDVFKQIEVDMASYQVEESLQHNCKYYWRVDSVNEHGVTEGNVWSFTTSTPEPLPVLLDYPQEGSFNNMNEIKLQWSPQTIGEQPTGYKLFLDKFSPPTTEVYDGSEPECWLALDFETEYFWRVVPYSEFATADVEDTTIWSFRTIPSISEDFESGDFTKYEWDLQKTGPNSDFWSISSEEVYSGDYSARSGLIEGGGSSSLIITLKINEPGYLSFFQKYSTEKDYDIFRFYIDGQLIDEWSGERGWGREEFFVEPGYRTFRWTYTKDAHGDFGSDAVWLDNITFPPHPKPIVIYPPTQLICDYSLVGYELTWSIEENEGADPMLFQFLGYNVYCKSDSEEEFERVTDEPIEHSSYFVYYEMDGLVDYYVTAMYRNMGKLEESEPSNSIRVEVGSQIGVPIVEPPAGTYQNEIEVSIETQEANAVVFYTLDGTEPGVESVEYIEPFVLSENSIVKVRSYKKGRLCSDVFRVDYTFETSDVDNVEMISVPFDLKTYPNPFNMSRQAERGLEAFRIEYSLNKDYDYVELSIYNIKGELINRVYPKHKSKGKHLLSWDLTSHTNKKITSGMYLLRLQTEEKSVNKKILLIK